MAQSNHRIKTSATTAKTSASPILGQQIFIFDLLMIYLNVQKIEKSSIERPALLSLDHSATRIAPIAKTFSGYERCV